MIEAAFILSLLAIAFAAVALWVVTYPLFGTQSQQGKKLDALERRFREHEMPHGRIGGPHR